MVKQVRKRKERRRVSFSIPDKQEDSDADNAPAFKVSVQDGNEHDDEFETMEDSVNGNEKSKTNIVDSGYSESNASDETADLNSDDDYFKGKRGSDEEDYGAGADPEGNGISEKERLGSDSESSDESNPGDESDSEGKSGSEDESVSSDGSEDGKVPGEEAGMERETRDAEVPHEKAPSPLSSFGEMALDPRVERAIERIGWRKPTPVQSAVIPAALSGRDVLVSAPTGSGKTGAYVVPIVQHLCQTRTGKSSGARAVVLVPTRELVQQVAAVFKLLCKYIDGVQVAAVTGRQKMPQKGENNSGRRNGSTDATRTQEGSSAFTRSADIMVGTPASILKAAGSKDGGVLGEVEFVVVDEADLVLSYGYENDARAALAKTPITCQSMLLSATLDAEGISGFRKLVLRRPLTIKVTTDGNVNDGDPTGATHYFARLRNNKDRYLVAYAMLRLNVICGKVLIFVNHVNSAFRLKLFLDQFKVKSAVLNSELPANSRMHCVDQFNAGIFDILIATDEAKKDDALLEKKKVKEGGKGDKKEDKKKRKRGDKDEEFGLSRGIDFRDVAAVLNFDMPDSQTNYTHRAGRTARAGRTGTVLSLICSRGEEKAVLDIGRSLGVQIGPLAFRMDQIEAFRYRVEDCLRMVTDAAVNGARLADVHREIVNSEQLQDYFEDNPQDLDALQHNLSLAKNVPEHLAHIPSYLLPPALRGTVTTDPRGSKFRTKRRKTGKSKASGRSRNNDPLKSFSNTNLGGSSRQRFRERHGIVKKPKDDGGHMPRKRKRSYKMR